MANSAKTIKLDRPAARSGAITSSARPWSGWA